MGEAKRRRQARMEHHHFDGPIPGLEMYRDLPRKPGAFYFVLTWTNHRGEIDGRSVVRPATPADVAKAHEHFQVLLRDKYQSECERIGFQIDVEEFTDKQTPLLAERASELLCNAKGEQDLRLDAPAGLLGFCLAAWIVSAPQAAHLMDFDTLLTLAVALTFDNGEFVPVVAADHGDQVKRITIH